MINEKMQSMFNDFKPVNEPTIRVIVNCEVGALVGELSKVLMMELVRVGGSAGERLLRDLDDERIRRYLATLGWLRRVRTAGLSNKTTQMYRHVSHAAAVPVLWYQALIGIGRAYDRDYSIEFVPGTSISESDLLAPDEMQTISDIMFSMQNNGFKVVAGIPKDEEGELDFMAMAHVEETVLSYRKTHPVYAFLAAFFKSQEVSKTLGSLVRIRYGVDSDYRVMLTRVVSSLGGDG